MAVAVAHNITSHAKVSAVGKPSPVNSGATPSTSTGSGYIPENEDFEGHPDIAPGITVARNVTIRRRTMEGTDASSSQGGNNDSMRAAMELLMDPENDLAFDVVTALCVS